MSTSTAKTCSVCGAVLDGPEGDASTSCCPSCRTTPSPANQDPAGARPDPERTVLRYTTARANDDTSITASTLDYVPGRTQDRSCTVSISVSRTIGRFQVERILGSGAFGVVYQARDPLLDRQVALKVPRFAPDDAEMMERFLREARAAARLRHPNIVAVFESGHADECPYIASEFVDGVPLAEVLRERPPDMRTAVDWVRQVAEALAYAHSEGIVHRDIKPANIMLSGANRPQVMDFGLAKRDADQAAGMTTEGAIVGTPAYMAPEQARGEIQRIGPRSDQYSVGVMLYEILCGRRPYTGDPLLVLSSVASARELPPTLRSVRGEIPRDLEACCLKAMEKEPEARYPSLQDFATDLDHWLKGLPLVARPLSLRERLVRWCRKNRLIAALTASLAALIVTAAVVGFLLAFKFQALATRASNEAADAKKAREHEKAARLAAEQVLVDTFTETGLTADRNGDPYEAILWFANAAATGGNHPERKHHNRIRLHSWLPTVALPAQVFEHPPDWSRALTWHPSGRYLLSLSFSGECVVRDLETGKRLAGPFSAPVAAALWNADGTRLAIAAGAEVALYAFPGNKRLDHWTQPDGVTCLQFSPDSQRLVIAGETLAQVISLELEPSAVRSFDLGSRASSAEFSPDGRHLAVRCEDQKVRVFSTETSSEASEPWDVLSAASPSPLAPMFVSKDRLAIVDSHAGLRCHDLATRGVVWEQKVQRVLSAAVSPDRKWIGLGEDFNLVLLDAATGQPVGKRFTHKNLINDIKFHPQLPRVLTTCVDHSASLIDVPSGQAICPPVPHTHSVHRCAWSPDGATFATVQWDGRLVRVWKPGRPGIDHPASETARGPFVRFNRAGDRWIPVGFDTGRDRVELQVLDAVSGGPIGPPLSGAGLVSDADFIHGSPLMVLAGGSTREDANRGLAEQNLSGPGFVRFVRPETGKAAFPDAATPSQPVAVRASPDGKTVVALCHRGQVIVLDAATGRERGEHQAFHGVEATHGFVIRDRIRFSDDGQQFAVWGSGSSAELRQTATGKLLFELRHPSSFIHDVQFSPAGQRVATCSSDNTVRMWNTVSGKQTGAPLNHSGWIFSAQFSRDGLRLLTASSDHQARIWDVARGTPVLATRRHDDQVFGVRFLPNEDLFLVSTRDGQLTAWDATFGKQIAPAWRLPEMVYQLSHGNHGSQVVASGRLNPMRMLDWREWIVEPDPALSREDVRLLGEVVSAKRIHEGGAATSLTSAEWFDRWQRLRRKRVLSATKPFAAASGRLPH